MIPTTYRTAGTVTEAARVLSRSAKDIYVCATHACVRPAVERLSTAPITEVVVTNSIKITSGSSSRPNDSSVADPPRQSHRFTHYHESVSSLFD